MKIYIYWEKQKYFTSFKDVQDYYEQHCDHTSFNEFLLESYDYEDVFNFTEADRERVLKEYKNSLADDAYNWIRCYCTVVEIEAEHKENETNKQYFNCPDCGKPITFDAWEDIIDTSVDTVNGHYIKYVTYCCPHCNKNNITAKIYYSLKFEKHKIIWEE